jgi:hypothetical protein
VPWKNSLGDCFVRNRKPLIVFRRKTEKVYCSCKERFLQKGTKTITTPEQESNLGRAVGKQPFLLWRKDSENREVSEE